jgi:energy-coupling factor transporter ATP-binding protein EcfA2
VLGGSKKYCLLTDVAYEELRQAIASELDADASNFSEIARFSGVDPDSVTKILDRKTVSYSTLKKMMEGFGLELTESSYTKADPPKLTKSTSSFPPNPFEQTGLWGCDELLRRIFEQLGKGGSQALIGPAGCGKSEILRAIGQQGPTKLGRSERSFLYIDMHCIRDETGFFEELGELLNFGGGCDQNQLRRRLAKAEQSYVLCLDAIHVLTDEAFFPAATRNWLRGMAEMPGSPLQLMVASQKDLRQLFPDSSVQSSPLADFFSSQTERLDYWGLQQVTGFVAEHLRGTGVVFTSEQMADLYEQGGGRPREVRSAAAKLYDRMVAGVDQI